MTDKERIERLEARVSVLTLVLKNLTDRWPTVLNDSDGHQLYPCPNCCEEASRCEVCKKAKESDSRMKEPDYGLYGSQT
jgi:hypothetical protein